MSVLINKISNLFSFWRIRRYRVTTALLFGVGIFIITLFGIQSAHAASPLDSSILSVDYWLGVLSSILLVISGLFLKLTLFILSFMIELAGYNGYIDSPAVTVGWVMVRDMTNIVFVVILLLIAFGTILGIEQYEWKKLLVKFVFAAILVNFSRTVCGIFIDIGQVLMTTFVNGIAATAGGNLITAFNLDKIMNLSGNANPANIGASGFLVASIAAVFFTAIVMCVMGAFLYLLLARMVVLWVLIILSPLAFVLSVLPQTESYASEWWHELSANIITGPVLLFFVWLSFVTLGAGNIHSDIAGNTSVPNKIEGTIEADKVGNTQFGKETQTAGISEAMGWVQMANFAIAIAMLLVGVKTSQKLGGAGADAIGKGVEYGKSIGKAVTYRPASFVGRNALKYGGKAAWYLGKGDQKVNFFKRQWAGFQQWRHDDGFVPVLREKWEKGQKGDKVDAEGYKLDKNDKRIQEKDDKGNLRFEYARKQRKNEVTGQMEDTDELEYQLGKDGKPIRQKRKFDSLQRFLNQRAMSDISSAKLLEKTEKDRDVTIDIAKKRTKGTPVHFFQAKAEKGVDALDRVRQGILEGEEARSSAKTAEFKPLGKNLLLGGARIQFGEGGEIKLGAKVAEQIAAHKTKGNLASATEKRIEEEAEERYKMGAGKRDFAQTIFQEKKAHHAAEVLDNLKTALTRDFNKTKTGQEMTKAEAEAKNIKEGFQAEEELRIMKAQFEIFKENKNRFNDFLKQAGGDKRKAWELIAQNQNLMTDHSGHGAHGEHGAHAPEGMSAFFAAKAIGERDHEYSFYQAKKRETVDLAAETLIWKKRGMSIATTAAQEGIVEGLMKNIRNMDQRATLGAFQGFLQSVEERKNEDGTYGDDRDKYYSESLIRHMYEKGWPDDGVKVAWETALQKMGEVFKMSEDETKKFVSNIADRAAAGKAKGINRSNQNQVVGFLGEHKIDSTLLQNIRERNVSTELDEVRARIKVSVENNPALRFMGIETVEQLERAIQDIPKDEFDDLKSKLK